jgi:hypothetical protein
MAHLSRSARLCWYLHAHRWAVAATNIAAAALFVIGSIGFFWPSYSIASAALFLVGSLLFLLAVSASALLDHGPST